VSLGYFEMKLITQIKKGEDLTKKEYDFLDAERTRQYGKKTNLFSRKYHKESNFFFVKSGKDIVAFGFLRPVEMTYKNRNYSVFALGGIMVVNEEKGKGYGKILIQNMINHSKKTGKTILGFCGEDLVRFYRKAGLKSKKDFSLRIEMENPNTKERIPDADGACPGVYYEGKDKFITTVSKTKGIATYWMPDIKKPHF
jgi:predicted N-acetyltransferase YhbS